MTTTREVQIDEALSDRDRNDRAVRKRVALTVQGAVKHAVKKVMGIDQMGDMRRNVTRSGNFAYTVSIPTADSGTADAVRKAALRTLRQAGVSDASARITAKGDETILRLVVDRAYLVTQGMTNPQLEVQLNAIDEVADVSKPITSSGSTKGALPGGDRTDQEDGEEASDDTGANTGAQPNDSADDAEKIFESLRRGIPVRATAGSPSTRINVSDARIAGEPRHVRRAKLLWKRKDGDTFVERWMFLANSIDDLVKLKREILSGTDIPPSKLTSPDGKQGFAMEQFGDLVFITIHGLER